MCKDFNYPKFKKELKRELRMTSRNRLRSPLGKNITFDQIKIIDNKLTSLSKENKLYLVKLVYSRLEKKKLTLKKYTFSY